MAGITVVADVHERRSGIPALLERLGVDVRLEALPAADYDLGGATLVERKTSVDLAMSLGEGRFWRQIHALRQRSRFPVLLIEGHSRVQALSPRTVRGLVLAVADQGVVVIWSDSPADSADWLLDLARRRQAHAPRDRPPYAQRRRNVDVGPGEAVLSAVDGISVHSARALLHAFGTVRAVMEASEDEWMTVPGIGPRRARAMAQALGSRTAH